MYLLQKNLYQESIRLELMQVNCNVVKIPYE